MKMSEAVLFRISEQQQNKAKRKEYMKLCVTMVFALVIAFFAAHSFTSLFEQEYKLTFRRSVILFCGLFVLLFLLISLALLFLTE